MPELTPEEREKQINREVYAETAKTTSITLRSCCIAWVVICFAIPAIYMIITSIRPNR